MSSQQYYIFKSETQVRVNNLFNHNGIQRWCIAERTIEDNMLVFCVGGSGAYVIEGVPYEVKRGRILFISHGVVHSASQSDDHNPVQVIAVRLSFGADDFSPFHLCYDCQDYDGYYGILQLLLRYYQRYEGSIPAGNANMLLRAFFHLLSAELDFYSDNDCFDEKMEAVSSAIENRLNCRQSISLQEMLDETRLSKYEFGRRFAASFHMNFKRYLFLRRMRFAKRLLQQTDLRIKEVALAVGYSDAGIFSNQYKKTFRVTPRNDRQ